MVAEQQFSRRGYGRVLVFICAVTVALSGTFLFAAEQKGNSGPARYRVFSLRHISADQGKKYLAEAGIGTVSQLPSPNTLLVTAQPAELIKASALLKLVDADELFCIKAISTSSEAKNLPSNKQIAAEVGKISIGTFSEPPTPAEKTKAIIDIHNDAVTVVAPAEQLEKIISAIKQLQETKTQAMQPDEPNKSAEPNQTDEPKPEEIMEMELEELHSAKATKDGKMGPERTAAPGDSRQVETDAGDYESDELFNELLDSLAKAEKMAAEQAQKPSEPNEPNAITTVPETKEPNKPSAAPSQTEETAFQAAKQTQSAVLGTPDGGHLTVEPNLPAVEGLEAKDAAEKPKLQPQPEPAPEQVEIETEQPSEVTEPVSKVRSYEPEPITTGDEMLELDLPAKLNIIDLLDLVGKYLQLDYMYDEADVKGKEVSLKVQGPIKVRDLYPLLESVLKFKGFVMTRKVNLVTIVPTAKVLEIDPDLHTDADKLEYGDVMITRVFALKHIDTANAKNLLDQMKLGVNTTAIPESGTLIVTGYAYRMARIEELLEMIDKPGEAKKFRFRQLKYTMAATLAPKIKALAEQLGTISITIAAAPAAAPKPTRARKPAPRKPAPAPAPTAKPTVYLDADERTNRILMIGLEDQLVIIDKLIDTLDVEYQDLRTLRLYEIQNVGAEEIKEKLGEIGIITTAGRPTTRAPTRAKARQPAKPTAPTATKEPLTEEPQVVVIEATNSLLVNATAGQHIQIATIIAYVDSETEEAQNPYVIYPLENQDPDELSGILEKLIQETITEKGKDDKIVRTTTRKKIEEDITIVPDPKSYSLIVYASKKNQQWIASLIKELDEYRPQVLLDVTLVQITKDDVFNFDLDLLASIPDMAYTSGKIAGIDSTIFDKLLLAPDRNKFIDMKSVDGTFKGFYGDKKINALITAVQTKKYGRVMARPKLLVNDNETGTIKTTDTTYITRTDTSFIRDQDVSTPIEQTVFEDYSAGITLEITPHISTGDMLRLEITLNRSNFTESLEDLDKPPDKADADVTTVVTVPDGSTIILGGMENITHYKGGDKIPFLGDLPLIGGLFRDISKTDLHDKLYIFVKAHILRPGGETALAELKEISRKNRETFERLETEMHRYEDWPGIKPEPMDPLQILEAD